MKVAFVTNICPHYRVRTFETLARYDHVDYYFFSAGDEWYWQRQHGVKAGEFHYEYLRGIRLGRTRFMPTLPLKLWLGRYEVYIKCINGRFALPVTYFIARLKRKPFILWTGIWARVQTAAHRLLFPITRYFYRHADAIVVYGEHVKRYLISEGVPAGRIFVAAHAVDNACYQRQVAEEEKSDLRRELGIKPEQKVVLYLGRLEEGKGLSYLLEAFASLQREGTVLILAGSGAEQSRLKKRVEEKEMSDRVRWTGHLSPEMTIPYYAIAWVYVLPSITTPVSKEPWGLVINEAFNQGLPVIATDAVGAAAGGLVQDGLNGFVVPERNSKALAHALQRILDDAELRERLGQNARKIIAGWDNERMVLGFRHAIAFTRSLQNAGSPVPRVVPIENCTLVKDAKTSNQSSQYTQIRPAGGDTGTPLNLQKRLALIEKRLGKLAGKRILDCGCGAGEYVSALNRLGADAWGIEFDEKKVLKFKSRNHRLADRVSVGDIQNINFDENSFDVALVNEALEHVPDDERALREVHRILKPGGALVLFSPNRLYPFETHGVFLRRSKKKIPHYLPFIPYLPLRFGKTLFDYWARNYWPGELRRMVIQRGFILAHRDYVWQTFENISGHQPFFIKAFRPLLRKICAAFENVPLLRVFGVSQVIIARKATARSVDLSKKHELDYDYANVYEL
jgi:glycosyltransferase involved in cell wall biosynthesis/SAM-dependent methyltransferase